MRAEVAESINSQMWRESTVSNFLNSLFGKISNENLFICITHSKRNQERKNEDFQEMYFPCTSSGIKEAVSHIFSIDKNREIYFGCAVLSKQSRNKESAEILTFIWADLDFRGKKQNYPTSEEILKLFSENRIPRPSTIIHTGNGYHCYWILKEPVKAVDHPDIYKKWLYHLKDKLNKNVDLNSELAKILRIPCTYNNKIENNQLHVAITAIGNCETYDSEQFIKQCVSETPLTDTETGGKVLFQENHATTTEKKCRNIKREDKGNPQKRKLIDNESRERISACLKRSPKLKDLYKGDWKKYDDYPSQSEADMALCGMLAFIFDDSETVKQIFISSKLYRKAKGFKYVERTVNKAMRNKIEPKLFKRGGGKKTGYYEFNRLHGKTLKARHKTIIQVLIDLERETHLPDGHVIYAGYRTFAKRGKMSPSTAERTLVELHEYGIVSHIKGKCSSGEKEASQTKRIIPIPKTLQSIERK